MKAKTYYREPMGAVERILDRSGAEKDAIDQVRVWMKRISYNHKVSKRKGYPLLVVQNELEDKYKENLDFHIGSQIMKLMQILIENDLDYEVGNLFIVEKIIEGATRVTVMLPIKFAKETE